MLIERAQSYSPQSRAAAWERSRYKRCDGKGKATQPPCHAVPRPWGWGHTVGSPPWASGMTPQEQGQGQPRRSDGCRM